MGVWSRITRTVAAGAALAVSGVFGLGALPASATGVESDTAEGLWYVDQLGLDELHGQATGEGVTIALIDSPVNVDIPELQSVEGATVDVNLKGLWCEPSDYGEFPVVSDESDVAGVASHGTSMAALIVGGGPGEGLRGEPAVRGVAPDATLNVYVTQSGEEFYEDTCLTADPLPQEVPNFHVPYDASKDELLQNSAAAAAAWAAMDDGADIIVTTARAAHEERWAPVVARALDEEVLILAAGPLLEEDYAIRPADLNGIVNVGMSGPAGFMTEHESRMDPSANRAILAPGINVQAPGHNYEWRPGPVTGTTYATAVAAGVVALGLEKHHDATPHQVLSALLRTSGDNPDEIVWEDPQLGFGIINAREFLNMDGVADLDVGNPVFSTDGLHPYCDDCELVEWPTAEDIQFYLEGEDPTPEAEPTEEPATEAPTSAEKPVADDPAEEVTSTPGWVWPVVLSSLVVAIAAVLALWWVVRRRPQKE